MTEIHTCTPAYVDRRQWLYDPMTGEPLINGWPLYSGLPQPEQCTRCGKVNPAEIHTCTPRESGCAECGKKASEGWALYCVECSKPMREWVGLTDEEIRDAYGSVCGKEWCIGGMGNAEVFYDAIEAKLKEKNG